MFFDSLLHEKRNIIDNTAEIIKAAKCKLNGFCVFVMIKWFMVWVINNY